MYYNHTLKKFTRVFWSYSHSRRSKYYRKKRRGKVNSKINWTVFSHHTTIDLWWTLISF